MTVAPLPDFTPVGAAMLERDGKHISRTEILCRCINSDHPDEHPSGRWNTEKTTFYCDACGFGCGGIEAAQILGVDLERPWNPADHASRKHRTKTKKTAQWCVAESIAPELEQTYWGAVGKQWPGPLPRAAEDRGFTPDDGPVLGFTRWPRGDLMFPLLDPLGNITGAKVRLASPGDGAKYLPVGPNTRRAPYNRPEWPGGGNDRAWCSPCILFVDTVLVVEGELSAMVAYLAAGDQLGVMGTNGTSGKLWREVLQERHVIIYADGDDPGQKALERWASEAKIARAKTVTALAPLDDGMDFCDFAHQDGREALRDWLA